MSSAKSRPFCLGLNVLTHWARQKADDVFNAFFINEQSFILIKIWLNFAYCGPIDNKSAIVQEMTWRRPGASRYLYQYVSLWPSPMTHICVTSPQVS